VQAGCVAAPRALDPDWAGARLLRRFRGRGWAAIPIASIVGVIFLIRYTPDSATWISDLALVAVPLLAALALGWAARGARPWYAVLAVGLFVLAWRAPATLEGEAAGALLDGLSCVTLGVLLAAVTPSAWCKAGIVAMSCADVWLVASQLLQAPNQQLASAAPPSGLPQLQSEAFGSVTLGYGDLFVAGLLGGVLAGRRPCQWTAAVLTLVIAALFDLLFLVFYDLPATVPVALALLVIEGWRWAERRRRAGDGRSERALETRAASISAGPDRSRPAGATPPRGS
jgi:hypothetical protein